MKIEKYLLNADHDAIFITITVSTPGIASTRVDLTYADGNSKRIGNSSGGDGSVARISIGNTADLDGSLVEVSTDILLDQIPAALWPSCFENLVIQYKLEGGKTGQAPAFICQESDKEKSDSGRTICVEKYIRLVK